eukprot:gnl/TRDRNA2_/TRDRNA2_196474_c0_seq1.p2 gnl/TRDRNA2_/TRDRNA2_196474_c0~~gnl/TRDRNA2_/TRDRNA2_196474_c0_seq1.p2  ORF type:complete len:185 (+),score=46.72 gnl/TRDRNA2_/TRDRNA2_196474_c0_seq1:54-608(+)
MTPVRSLAILHAAVLSLAAPWDGFNEIPGSKTTYKIIREGDPNSAAVARGMSVTVHAAGTTRNPRKRFWSTKEKGQKPYTYEAGSGVGSGVIKGWDKGAMGMKIGEIRVLRIPASEGYGSKGFPSWGIGRNENLEFEIEVLDMVAKKDRQLPMATKKAEPINMPLMIGLTCTMVVLTFICHYYN